jgi:hypothetical protein
MQYPYMNDDKYLNHAFKYCLNEQVQALCNIFIFIYLSLNSAIARSIGVATMQVSAT